SSGSLPSLRLLVVDDNELNLKVAQRLLESWGQIVVVAKNGIEAVEMFQKSKFYLILMDCQMPLLDGYSATRRIREIENGTLVHTPIVAMTAHAMHEHKVQSLESGMDDHLTKPINRSELRSIIERFAK
ncbi:MAG: response regulator, partial [Bdellovibrionales bacterium]|nr:response regulator [Bdellovibrionales bacterium]